MESLGRCSGMTKAQAKAARAKQEEAANGEGIPSKRDGMTLGAFRPFYWENRARGDAPKTRRTSKRYAKLSEGSLSEHDMAIRYLVEHFGERCRLDDIDELAAEGWHTALANGKLSGARQQTEAVREYAAVQGAQRQGRLWAGQGVRDHSAEFSRRGKPTDNGLIEAFNGRLRAECLNENWFLSLEDARGKVESWRRHYNGDRPHSALGNLAPREFAASTSQVGLTG